MIWKNYHGMLYSLCGYRHPCSQLGGGGGGGVEVVGGAVDGVGVGMGGGGCN